MSPPAFRVLVGAVFLVMATSSLSSSRADTSKVHGPPARFALVIGVNTTGDPEVPPLRYADDDAVQNAALLQQLGAQVVLLVELDAESLRLHGDQPHQLPTVAVLERATEILNQRMDLARAEGKRPILYLFYSGHGDVENNEGYVRLADGRLSRTDFHQLLRSFRADLIHAIVDACKSYFLVYERGGGGGQRQPLTAPLPLPGDVVTKLPPHVGLLLSTSSAADSHEWEAFQGGIFSHQVRSALRGAADLNRDGRVTYEEVAAFVWTANSTILNPRFRPLVFTRPPAGGEGAQTELSDLRAASGDLVTIGPHVDHHIYVEDERGRRLADLHPPKGRQVTLILPEARPLFLREPNSARQVELPAGRHTEVQRLPDPAPGGVGRRGAEHLAFRRLFQRPFNEEAWDEHRTLMQTPLAHGGPLLSAPSPSPYQDGTGSRWLKGAAAVTAMGAGATGVGLLVGAHLHREGMPSHESGLDRWTRNQRIDRMNRGGLACLALAGGATLFWLGRTLLEPPPVEIPFYEDPVAGHGKSGLHELQQIQGQEE